MVPLVTIVSATQPAGGEVVGRAGSAQRGEHVELPGLEIVCREGLLAGAVEVAGEARDPAQDLHGGDVDVGTLPFPGGDDGVDLVGLLRLTGHTAMVVRQES